MSASASPAFGGKIPAPMAVLKPGLLPTPMAMVPPQGVFGAGSAASADGGILNELLMTLKIPQGQATAPAAPTTAPAPTTGSGANAAAGGGGLSLAGWAASILHTPPQPLAQGGSGKGWVGKAPPKPAAPIGDSSNHSSSSAASASNDFKFDVGAIMAHFP